jgi:hypothetical protein
MFVVGGEELVVPGENIVVCATAAGASAKAASAARRVLSMAVSFRKLFCKRLSCKLYSQSYSLSSRRALPP